MSMISTRTYVSQEKKMGKVLFPSIHICSTRSFRMFIGPCLTSQNFKGGRKWEIMSHLPSKEEIPPNMLLSFLQTLAVKANYLIRLPNSLADSSNSLLHQYSLVVLTPSTSLQPPLLCCGLQDVTYLQYFSFDYVLVQNRTVIFVFPSPMVVSRTLSPSCSILKSS